MLSRSFPVLQTSRQNPNLPDEGQLSHLLCCHYPMDGSTITKNSSLSDTSGSFNGIFTSAANATLGGSVLPFLSMDGGGGVEGLRLTNTSSYVSFPFPAALPTGAAARSFCCWVYPFDFTNYIAPINYGTATSSVGYFQVYVDKTTHVLTMSSGTSGVIVSTTTIPSGAWSHIGWSSFDGGSLGGYFWINGAIENKSGFTLNTMTTGDNFINGTNTAAGAPQLIYGNYIVRDWRVYSYGLNYGEFNQIMASGYNKAVNSPYIPQAESMAFLSSSGTRGARSFGYIFG